MYQKKRKKAETQVIEREIEWLLTDPQEEADEYLHDDETEEIVFGGGAGGGKSLLGCRWLIEQCLEHIGSRWFIGRKELAKLKKTTMLTMFGALREWGLVEGKNWKMNWQDNFLEFMNGFGPVMNSRIYLLDLAFAPSDPEFERLGSFEFCGGFIDEAGEVEAKAIDVLRSRLRYKLDDFGIVGKMLMSCNPTTNFIFIDYYQPHKKGTLEPYKKFVQALPHSNPFLPKSYIRRLERIKDKMTRERLLNGIWEFDDDAAILFKANTISDMFTNPVQPNKKEKYMTVDVARLGDDKIVIGIWHGFVLVKIITKSKQRTTQTAQDIIDIANAEGIRRSHIAIDEEGVGGGVVDQVEGCVSFVGGSSAIQPKNEYLEEGDEDFQPPVNYANLRSQCIFELAYLAERGGILVVTEDQVLKEKIMNELRQLKRKNIEKAGEGKLAVIPKDDIKKNLGRSPDYSDMMMMRMIFAVKEEEDDPDIRFLG